MRLLIALMACGVGAQTKDPVTLCAPPECAPVAFGPTMLVLQHPAYAIEKDLKDDTVWLTSRGDIRVKPDGTLTVPEGITRDEVIVLLTKITREFVEREDKKHTDEMDAYQKYAEALKREVETYRHALCATVEALKPKTMPNYCKEAK